MGKKMKSEDEKKVVGLNRMFSRYTCGIILLLFTTVASAQQGFRIGPTGSVLLSRSSITDTLFNNYNFRYKTGFNAGIRAQYGFTEGFGLSASVLLVSKGYRVFNDSNKHGNRIRHNFYNFEVPVNIFFNFKTGATRLRGVAGLAINSVLSKSGALQENSNSTFAIKEEVKTAFYPMINLGVEIYKVGNSGDAFIFSANYKQAFQQGTLLHVYNSTSNPELFALGFRGSYLSVGVSYLFNLKNLKRGEQFFE